MMRSVRILVWIMVALAIIGFADANYLAAEHFAGSTPNCSIIEGCDIVTTSLYATIGPVPIALLGALYYLVVLLAGILFLDRGVRGARLVLLLMPTIGFGVSLFLIYLQIAVLNAICVYCMASATTSTALFVLGVSVFQKTRSSTSTSSPSV